MKDYLLKIKVFYHHYYTQNINVYYQTLTVHIIYLIYFFLEKKFSQRNYFLETGNSLIQSEVKQNIKKLFIYLNEQNYYKDSINIHNFIQTRFATPIFLKSINKVNKFFGNRFKAGLIRKKF